MLKANTNIHDGNFIILFTQLYTANVVDLCFKAGLSLPNAENLSLMRDFPASNMVY